jgi:hypothetical protein
LPDTVEISSGAYVPEPGYGQVHGPITALTSEPHDGRVRWTYVVDGTSFAVELPPEIAFPAAQGDVVEAFARVTGGGPNAFGNVRLRDASGALLLCVDYLPDGWLADYGTPVSSRRGPDYDTVNYRARVSAPDGSRAELGSEWRKVMLAGARYLGSAYATKNLLHGDAPADFVREWIDVSLVRVSAP